jgi:hypothetical protein
VTWIRVQSNAGDDPKWARIGKVLGLSADECFGKMVRLWGRVADHEPEGDLSTVPDTRIEEWAHWTGKAGRFAKIFRQECVSDGWLNGWDELQGKLVARARVERQRKAAERARTKLRPSAAA